MDHQIIFEPNCAYCTVGSYASLSVHLSVCHWIIIDIMESYIVRNLKLYHNIPRLGHPHYILCSTRPPTT